MRESDRGREEVIECREVERERIVREKCECVYVCVGPACLLPSGGSRRVSQPSTSAFDYPSRCWVARATQLSLSLSRSPATPRPRPIQKRSGTAPLSLSLSLARDLERAPLALFLVLSLRLFRRSGVIPFAVLRERSGCCAWSETLRCKGSGGGGCSRHMLPDGSVEITER